MADQITTEAARAALAREKQERVEKCNQEIADVLKKHNCDLIPRVVIVGGQIASDIQIVAKDSPN